MTPYLQNFQAIGSNSAIGGLIPGLKIKLYATCMRLTAGRRSSCTGKLGPDSLSALSSEQCSSVWNYCRTCVLLCFPHESLDSDLEVHEDLSAQLCSFSASNLTDAPLLANAVTGYLSISRKAKR
jgi:hypothetical protein